MNSTAVTLYDKGGVTLRRAAAVRAKLTLERVAVKVAVPKHLRLEMTQESLTSSSRDGAAAEAAARR